VRSLDLFSSTSIYILFFTSLISITACSPSEKDKKDGEQTDTSINQYETDTQETIPEEEMTAPDGWRKGKLRIQIDIQQAGGVFPPKDGVTSEWTSKIHLVSEADVMLAEDLRPYVTEGPLPNTQALEYEPFYLIDPNVETIKSSEVDYKASWAVNTSEIKNTIHGTLKGVVDRVYLQALHPSLYGPGYEASIVFNVTGQLKKEDVIFTEGQPITNNIDEKKSEEVSYHLHPVPNAEKLNNYDYVPEGIDESLKQSLIQQKLDTLSLLNQTYKDSLPVQGPIRAGTKSEATQNKLTLTYEYNGDKEVSHAAMIGVNVGMATTSKTKITIELTATP
jgi:hypothetical protein